MMDRQKGNLVFECDGCGETLETNTSSFEAAQSILKRNGWKPEKNDDNWEHYCNGCNRS